MDREEKIKIIYEKIADKELSFGCLFKVKNFDIHYDINYLKGFRDEKTKGDLYGVYLGDNKYGSLNYKVKKIIPYDKDLEGHINDFRDIEGEFDFEELGQELEIIGHTVMIGDVLDFIFENEITKFENIGISEIKEKLIKLWILNLRASIEKQSDECIDYVYNLIQIYEK